MNELAKMSPERQALAAAVLWDLLLGGAIVKSPNGVAELRDRLAARGVDVSVSQLGVLLRALHGRGVALTVSGKRTSYIRLTLRRDVLPPCPFDDAAPDEMEPFEADVAATDGVGLVGPGWPHRGHATHVSIPESLQLISRVAGDALVEWAAVNPPTDEPDADTERRIADLVVANAELAEQVESWKATATAETTARREAEQTIAGLLNGGRVAPAPT